MRLSKSDIIAFSGGALILAALSFLLYADIMRQSGAGITEVIGTVKSKRNVAERKYSAQVVWDEVGKNAKVHNYDTIRTADHSEAIIRLKDGTEITLSENSMILLAITEKEYDIKFMQGAINAKQAQGKDAAGKKLNIMSGESKISVDNGDVNLAQGKDNKLAVTVRRGEATFASGKEKKVLKENQNILADKDSLRLYDLTIKLTYPENNASLTTAGDRTAINFSWLPLRGNYNAYLEVATNPSLADPIIKKRAAGNTAPAYVPDGTYFWRVTALNNNTKKVETSETRKLTVINNRPVRLIAPANKSTIKYWDVNPMINFIWSRNESVPRYTLVISKQADMSSPAVNTLIEGNKISLNNLGQGAYFWKIINVPDTAQASRIAESAVHTFTVSKTDKLSPPEPIYPTENKTIHPLMIPQKGVNFTWRKDASIPETQLMISENREFTKVLVKKNSGDNFLRVRDALKEGTYYWNLRGIMGDGSATDYSSTQVFRVTRGEEGIRLIEPRDNAVMVHAAEKAAAVTFSWSQAELDGNYLFQVSTDKNFANVVQKQTLSDLSAVVRNINNGAYYWQVKLIDDKGSDIIKSPVHSFEVLGKLDVPVAVSPRNGSTVSMIDRNALEFQWNMVKGANLYRIGLYQLDRGIQHSIYTIETKNNRYQFTDLKKLDEGKFLWSLQALDANELTRRERRRSDEARMLFDITLGGEKKIIYKSPKILYVE